MLEHVTEWLGKNRDELLIGLAVAAACGAAGWFFGFWKSAYRKIVPPKTEPTIVQAEPGGLPIRTDKPLDVRVSHPPQPKPSDDALFLLAHLYHCPDESRLLRHCRELPEHIEIGDLAFYNPSNQWETDRFLIAFNDMQKRGWLTKNEPQRDLYKMTGDGLAVGMNLDKPEPYKGPPPTYDLTPRQATLISHAFHASKPIRVFKLSGKWIIRAGRFQKEGAEASEYINELYSLDTKGHAGPWLGHSDNRVIELNTSGRELAKRLPKPESAGPEEEEEPDLSGMPTIVVDSSREAVGLTREQLERETQEYRDPPTQGLLLDVLPHIRHDITDPTNVTRWVLQAGVTATVQDVHIRDAYLETSDGSKLRPSWFTFNDDKNGAYTGDQLVHTLPKGKHLTLTFATRTEANGGTIVPPDYYSAPWGNVANGTRIVIRTLEGDQPSLANSAIRALADGVARYRNTGGRVKNSGVTFKTGGGIGRTER